MTVTSIHSSPARPRWVLLDLARCLAIVLMVFAHVTDSLLDPAERLTTLGFVYSKFRGVTAPLFFLLSGWVFALTTSRDAEAYRHFSPELNKRLRRVALLVGWGYALTLPWWARGFPLHADPQVWHPFWSFGVLQCVGFSLLVGHLLWWALPGRKSFTAVCLGWVVLVVPLAQSIQHVAVNWPAPLRGILYAGPFNGGFPLAPWSAYFMLGAAVGSLLSLRPVSAGRIGALSLAGGAVSFGLSRLLHSEVAIAAQPAWAWAAMPSAFFHRLAMAGVALALVSALVVALQLTQVPRALRIPSEHALTFYVGHMLMLWGMPGLNGLVTRLGTTRSFAECSVLTVLCLGGIWTLVWLIGTLRARSKAGLLPGTRVAEKA